MKTPEVFAQAKEQLQNLPGNASLAILHPDFHGQNRLLTLLLSAPAVKTIFLAMPEPGLSLQRLLQLLHEAVETQLGTSAPAFNSAEDAVKALAAIAREQGPVNLILSAFDLADQDDVAPLIQAMVESFPQGSRIILGTRELPTKLFSSRKLREKTTIIPVNPDKMILDYAGTSGKTILEVRALGPGRVLIDGRLIDHWDGILPRTLFFYFVDRGMTTRDEIFRTFWPNLNTREATNVFHVTKRKISEILGTDLTVYWSGFYRISPELELHYDVIKFAEAVQNAAVANDEEALVLLHNAIDLYRGPFLSTMEQTWIERRRSELASNYAEALAGLARIYSIQDDPLNALGFLLRASAANPQREDLVRSIMELYQAMGQPAEALEAYNRLCAELQSTLGVTPGPQTQQLADKIRASA